MNPRKSLLALAAIPLLALGACSQNDEQQSEPSTTASGTSTSAKPTEPKKPSPTSGTPTPESPTSEAASTTAVAEPYVVECEPSPPGPALWSDGSTRFSQDCYDKIVANRGAYQCPGTDAFFDDPADCNHTNLGGDPAYDSMYPGGLVPSDPPRADGCVGPTAVCGYYDEDGDPVNFDKLTGEISPR